MGAKQKRYSEIVFDPSEWRRLAKELFAAATALEPRLEKFWEGVRDGAWQDGQMAVYFMLCAYALENVMKATLVEMEIAKNPKPSAQGHLPKSLKGHDLVALAQRCGKCELAEEYASILMRLSRSAVWYGRYPVPISSNALDTLDTLPSGEPISLSMYASNDRNEVRHLLREFGLEVV